MSFNSIPFLETNETVGHQTPRNRGWYLHAIAATANPQTTNKPNPRRLVSQKFNLRLPI